jgi:hypothetical protein
MSTRTSPCLCTSCDESDAREASRLLPSPPKMSDAALAEESRDSLDAK